MIAIIRILTTVFALGLFAAPLAVSAAENACLRNVAIYDTPGSYTFAVPAGVTSLRVFAVGGGGGGGAGSGGWGSGGGAGCGGGIAGGTMSVTPGQKVSLYVGYGGAGGNGTANPTIGGCPWCGSYNPSTNGSSGGNSGIGSITAPGGSWGRTGYYNLYNNYTGGTGGGSGGGGGGNGWPGFQAYSTSGGTAGSNDPRNSTSAGGYCIGSGWSVDPAQYITKVPWSAGQGGQMPYQTSYNGGGGGGGVIINNNTSVKGFDAPGRCTWGCPGVGGAGYGGGGGGQGLDYQGAGGAGAAGVVYIEWDGGSNDSCALSCSISFDQNPLTSGSTVMRWTSSNASLFYINGVGYVSSSGSARVYGAGDYSGVASGLGSTASCPAILQGAACESAQKTCSADGNLRDSCGNVTACRYGCSKATNTCKNECISYGVCDAAGTRVIDSCTGKTLSDCASGGKSCVAGACVAAPVSFESFDADWNGSAFTASGHLEARPALLRAGQTARLYWNVKNAAACTISGTNSDSWTTLSSGASGKLSAPIMHSTVYTLHCNALSGATPAVVDESVQVNVAPIFQEQ